MGFLSSFFGGGSSSSSAKTEVTVNPVTNVDIDNEEVARQIKEASLREIQNENVLFQQDQAQKDKALQLEKDKAIAELNQDKQQSLYRNRQIVFFGGIALLIFAYKKGFLK